MYWLGLPMYCRIHLQCSRPAFDPWVGKIPWKREKPSTPVFWPGEFHGLCSPWGCKESDMTEWLPPHFTSCLGCYKQHCNEYWGACILSNHVFLWIYAQEQGWWVIQELYFIKFLFLLYFTLQYCIGFAIHLHESTTGVHAFPNMNPPPTSFPITSLWVITMHRPQACCILHQT